MRVTSTASRRSGLERHRQLVTQEAPGDTTRPAIRPQLQPAPAGVGLGVAFTFAPYADPHGCSWEHGFWLGWPRITLESHPSAYRWFWLGHRRARHRCNLGRAHVLVRRLLPQKEGRPRTAPPVRLQHAAGTGADVIPFVIISVLFYFTVAVRNRITHQTRQPRGRRRVTAFQWSWKFRYQKIAFATARSTTTAPTRREGAWPFQASGHLMLTARRSRRRTSAVNPEDRST